MIRPSELAVTIVDGYVDEPAHFGVPPYISTYPRFTAGALVDAGVDGDDPVVRILVLAKERTVAGRSGLSESNANHKLGTKVYKLLG